MTTSLRLAVWIGCGAAAALGGVDSLLARDDLRVEGKAEVQVRPDHVVLELGVETWNRELSAAREENDRKVAAVQEQARQFGIVDEDMAVDFAHVEIQRNEELRTAIDHYTVRRTVVLTLRDVDRFEDVLMGELQAGANYVHDVDFRTSELRKYADQARAEALTAAREKALDMAAVGGFNVSERPTDVFSVDTEVSTWYRVAPVPQYRARSFTPMQNVSTVVDLGGSDRASSSGGIGYLSVRASVDVEYEIER